MINIFLYLALAASLVSAHFDLLYPYNRGDPFEEPASEWIYPCANINSTGNRTMWPLTGGSVIMHLHHPWTYFFMNLGLGENTTAFNISLTPNLPYNETGNGTLCLPRIPIPEDAGVYEGAVGSLQIINVGDSGSALYNCADLMFSSDATLLTAGEGECTNTTGLTVTRIEEQSENGTMTMDDEAASTTSAAAAESSSSAASALRLEVGGGVFSIVSTVTVVLAMMVGMA